MKTPVKTIILLKNKKEFNSGKKTVFEDQGFHVIEAYSEREVEEIFQIPRLEIDIILIDILGINPLDISAAEIIRAQLSFAAEILYYRDLPLLFLTHETDQTLLEEMKRISPYGYTSLNVYNPDIIPLVTMAVQLHEARKENRQSQVMLKEMKHRIKSNLNLISNMLNHEYCKLEDEKFRTVFEDMQNRIRSMEGVYSPSRYSPQNDRVQLNLYLEDIAVSLVGMYMIDNKRINLKAEFETVVLDIKRAVPVGLILTELLTNALKYAYPIGVKGIIEVRMQKNDGYLQLAVTDYGVGIPEGVDFSKEETMELGIGLIGMLARQIDAEVSIKRNNGASVMLRLKL